MSPLLNSALDIIGSQIFPSIPKHSLWNGTQGIPAQHDEQLIQTSAFCNSETTENTAAAGTNKGIP